MKPKPIPFDSLNLYAVLSECEALVGGQLQEVRQPEPLTLVLHIYAQRQEHRLLISAHPQFARLHLITKKLPNAPTPPPFCQSLRKHLEGARLRQIGQVGFDRIVLLEFETPEGSYRLVAELMGKHSNLMLVHASGIIVSALKWVSPRQSQLRPIRSGEPYRLPPTRVEGLRHPLLLSDSEWHALWAQMRSSDPPHPPLIRGELEGGSFNPHPPLVGGEANDPPHPPLIRGESRHDSDWSDYLEGLSRFTAQELDAIAQQEGVEGLLEWARRAREARWQPVLVREPSTGRVLGAYPFPVRQLPAEWQHPRKSVNLAWEHAFTERIERAEAETVRQTLETALQRALQAREHARQELQRALSESQLADRYQLYGELILAFGYNAPPGAITLHAPDYTQPDMPLIEIPLDPEKSIPENAQRYFEKARRAREGQSGLQSRLQQFESEIEAIRHALHGLEMAGDRLEPLRELMETARRNGWLREPPAHTPKRAEKDPFEGHKIQLHLSPDGYQVLVGENAQANDFLLTRIARPNDWWLHVRTGTGAHVIIRTEGHPERVPRRTLEFAARLAAQHSADRHASVVEVDYTLRKYVRKPRHAPPGFAVYTHEKTLVVNPTAS
jgi:predicted ribosome quality control (RQC) complex YloA/Tae2 family protein